MAREFTQLAEVVDRGGGMITLALFWGFWATFVLAVMLVDRNARASEDFTPEPGGYFVLAAISPFLVLPIYFYSSRRSSTTGIRILAMLGGLAGTVVCFFLATYHLGFVVTALRVLVA